MTKKTKKPELKQPRLLIIIIASIVTTALVAQLVYYIREVVNIVTLTPVPQTDLIVALESALIFAAIAPFLIGSLVFLTAKGKWQRRYVVAAVYMAIYSLIEVAFAVFVPTYAIFSMVLGEQVYNESGINFFLSYAVGLIATTLIYFGTKKRTMNSNHWSVILVLSLGAVWLLLTVWNYFFVS